MSFYFYFWLNSITLIYSSQPYIWSLPQEYTLDPCSLPVSPNFTFTITNQNINNDILTSGITRYQSLIFSHIPDSIPTTTNQLTSLIIKLQQPNNTTLNSNTNESYILSIPSSNSNQQINAQLSAENVFGILKGLETFSQIITYNYTNGYYITKYCNAYINDKPRFNHRGIMLDTARHFISINIIKSLLNGMEYNKLNIFHWHMTDAESFPFLSKSSPKLTLNGAYSMNEIYSHNDIKYIINYAKYRGIRTIIEFDTPGHTGSWCKYFGYPNICPDQNCVEYEQEKNPNNIALDPTTNDTYNIIDGILNEITQLNYEEEYIHIGADEVVYYCWQQTPSINQWMTQNNITTYDQLYEYFVLR